MQIQHHWTGHNCCCLSSLTSEVFLAPCRTKITLDTRGQMKKHNDWGSLWISEWYHAIHKPLRLQLLVFCLSDLQRQDLFVLIGWPTCSCFWQKFCSEDGSQGRWLLLHLLINLEVTAQRGPFLAVFCCGEGIENSTSSTAYIVLMPAPARKTVCKGNFPACYLRGLFE